MSLKTFYSAIKECQQAINSANYTGKNLENSQIKIEEYEVARKKAIQNSISTSITKIEKEIMKLNLQINQAKMSEVMTELKRKPKISSLQQIIDLIPADFEEKQEVRGQNEITGAENPCKELNQETIPEEIKKDIIADQKELNSCINSGAYRSAVILCGRILETALHRKYYEKTGNDLLEKAPGIGLGNLIAKMQERGINLDPGLSNQIHLINQVRIWSVHKKQQAFTPTQNQAKAVMLYTFDVVNKLFG